jgi:hypothetical protein
MGDFARVAIALGPVRPARSIRDAPGGSVRSRMRGVRWHYSGSLGASYKPAAVGNLEQPVLPYHPSTGYSSIRRSQLYVKEKLIRCINN